MAETTTTMPASSSSSSPSLLSVLKRKLITKEDHWHVHKVIGIVVLLSYAWRFSRPWESEMGFLTHPRWTIPTVLLHLSLNLSSFNFDIPAQRIKNGGRIWPEYRLHALVFLLRSCVAVLIRHVFFTLWYQDSYSGRQLSPDKMSLFYWLNFALVMSNMALADGASLSVGDKSSRSIRDVKEIPVIVKHYFSIMQFNGTAYILASTNFSLVFYYAFVVQLNPFGMTLVRKNVISHRTNMILYGLELSMGVVLAYKLGHKDPYFIGPQILAFFAAFWRMGPWPAWVPRSKYLVWAGTFCLFQTIIRPIMEQQEPTAVLYMTHVADSLVVFMVVFMLYKQGKETTDDDQIFSSIYVKLRGISPKTKQV